MSLREPFNTSICQGDGTIFSTPSGGSSGGGSSNLEFINLGSVGARVLVGRINDQVQYRRLLQGANVQIVENAQNVTINVNDLAFDATAPVKRGIPSLQGVSLGTTTLLTTIHELLYPIIPPGVSLLLNPNVFEYGDTSNISGSWTVSRQDEPILTIMVNNVSIAPVTGNTQSGIAVITKTGLASVLVPMQATTATKAATTQQQASVGRKIRYGYTLKDGAVQQILDSDINGLTNAVFSALPTLTPRSLTIPPNQYIIVSIPNSVLNGATPTFKVNGFVNNTFMLRRSNAFTNTFGYTEPTSVWVTSSFGTGPISLEII